ncbi:hypothetical protein ABIA39_002793 [Nocardia sp. GAS34]
MSLLTPLIYGHLAPNHAGQRAKPLPGNIFDVQPDFAMPISVNNHHNPRQ